MKTHHCAGQCESTDAIQPKVKLIQAEKTEELFKTYFDRISDPGSNDPELHTNTCFCIQVR